VASPHGREEVQGGAGLSDGPRATRSYSECKRAGRPGWQGLTTRSLRQIQISDRVTSKQVDVAGLRETAPRCRRGRCDWDRAIERLLEALSMHTKVDWRRL